MQELYDARLALIKNDEYYGRLLINMRTIISDKVPTASVNITDKVNLYINPEFFRSLTGVQMVDLLKHEAQHIINGHPLRFQGGNIPKGEHNYYNVAADVAINEPLKSLHEFGWNQEKFAEFVEVKNMERHSTAEYYYSLIKQNEDKLKEDGKIQEMQSLDDHSLWEEGADQEGVTEEVQKQALKEILDKTAKETSAGNVPNAAVNMLNQLRKSTVSWKSKLRQFVAKANNVNKISTRKKRNRRYGTMFAGKKKKLDLDIAIAMDISGSVSNDEVTQFFAEIQKIYEEGAKITIIEADCEVQKVYEYTDKIKPQRNGSGGTAYQPAFDKASELGVDGVIYFGDMDAFDTPEKPKYPVLWAIVGKSQPPATWGNKCYVEIGEVK